MKKPGKVNMTSKEVAEMRNYNDLKNKNSKLEIQNEKNIKKLSEITQELNSIKKEKETLIKELSIAKISMEKILGEKGVLDNQIKDNKQYILKLETKIFELSKSKSQSIYEINQKLKKENDELNQVIANNNKEKEVLISEKEKMQKEIATLHNALNIKIQNLKFKDDIKASLFYDVGLIKQEMDEFKAKSIEKDTLICSLQAEIEKKNELLQELTFDKTNIVEELMTIKKENERLIKQTNEDMDEIERLRKEIEVSSKRLTEITNSYRVDSSPKNISAPNEEAQKKSDLLNDIQNSLKQEFNTKYTKVIEVNNKLSEQIKMLEKENKVNTEKINELNEIIKTKNNELNDLQSLYKTLTVKMEDYIEQNKKCKESLSQTKKDKDSLSKKLINVSMQKDLCDTENKKLKEQNHSLLLQIEQLKSKNLLLHQNLTNAIQYSETILNNNDNINPVDIGYAKVSETNILSLIKRESEKNKEYSEQIERIISS